MNVRHETQGQPSDISDLTLLINWERLCTDLIFCCTMFQKFEDVSKI